MNPNCLRCTTPIDLDPNQAVALCPACFVFTTTYLTSGHDVQHCLARLEAVRRLYARADSGAEDRMFPCDDDITPQPAPVYDEVERVPEPDSIYESVLRGERAAAARFAASKRGFGGRS